MKWLNGQLAKAGITSISDVFYAEVQSDRTLYMDIKEGSLH